MEFILPCVARPRVIIASPDANVAVKLIASLNPKRYRVEHIHDFNEGLLRAELVLAHAAVIHLEAAPPEIVKRCGQSVDRGLSIVLVSASPEVEAASLHLGGRFLPIPFQVQDCKRVVFRAVSDAHAQRSEEQPLIGRSAASSSGRERRVMLLLADGECAEIMAAVVRSQLSVTCDVATSAADGIALLTRSYECVVADPELIFTSEEGASLARKLARRGLTVLPLGLSDGMDASIAGQLAWDVVPQVRRTLAARDKLSRVS